MTKKLSTFDPEADGLGRVFCPVAPKVLKRVNSKQNNDALAQALKTALAKRRQPFDLAAADGDFEEGRAEVGRPMV